MATLNNKGHLSGGMGPIYYRTLNGKTIVQSKPGKGNVRHAKETLLSASEFGMASSMGKSIRTSLFPILQNKADKRMSSRLASVLYKAIINNNITPKGDRHLADGDLSQLDHFQFNSNSPYGTYCTLAPLLSFNGPGQLVISLPSFDATKVLMMPESATDCEICYMAMAWDPQTRLADYIALFKLHITAETVVVPAQQWHTEVLAEGQIIFLLAAVFYFRQDKLMGSIPLNTIDLHPCELVNALAVKGPSL